jgi:hypothetical protein
MENFEGRLRPDGQQDHDGNCEKKSARQRSVHEIGIIPTGLPLDIRPHWFELNDALV